jgi:hypothetical protein
MAAMKFKPRLRSTSSTVVVISVAVLCFVLNLFYFGMREGTTTVAKGRRSTVTICPLQSVESLKAKDLLKSQSEEDVWLLRWFNGLCGGRYIEMGGLDGVRYSNSYVFDFAFGWKGLMVEVTPTSFEKLKMNRPRNVLVNAGICESRRKVHYFGETGKYLHNDNISLTVSAPSSYSFSGVAAAGIVEFAAPEFREKFWTSLKPDLSNTIEIECVPLQDIFDQHFRSDFHDGSLFFDFFSLDVEGAEYHVLKSIDYTKISFGVLFLEADPTNEKKNTAIRSFLESKGYIFLQESKRSYWFVNPSFNEIYEHVLHV